MRRLIGYVHVDGIAYGPDDDVPAKVAKRIGDHAWVDDDAEPSGPELLTEPPRSGRGSGVEAWRAFATQELDAVSDEWSKEEIIAALERAEVIQPEPPKE